MSERLARELALLPERLAGHVRLTLVALAVAAAVGLPLAVLCARRRALEGPVLAAASVVQTIPALALLALMVPLLGRIGVLPALVALVLYGLLPILRNAVVGLREVDPALVDAGRGLGMTEGQLLREVRLPLALPVIVAGVRTAAVWTVGMATLATPVGALCLGHFLFAGLQTQNHVAVLVGVVAAATLALALDGTLRLGEAAARARDARLGLAAAGALVLVASTTLLGGADAGGRGAARIGAKPFTEQYVLGELLALRLGEAGVPARVLPGLGSTVAFDALASGELDLYVDYTGTLWATRMDRADAPGAEAVLAEVAAWLEAEHGIVLLGPLGFENAYALAMRRDRAEALGVRTLGDLARVADGLAIGGDYEFFDRPEWRAVREAYGLDGARTVTMDPTLLYPAVVAGEVDAIAGYTTDGRIAAHDLALLEDPREALPPYDAVLLLSADAARDGALVEALRPLVGAIDADAMRRANLAVDLEGEAPEAAARALAREVAGS